MAMVDLKIVHTDITGWLCLRVRSHLSLSQWKSKINHVNRWQHH